MRDTYAELKPAYEKLPWGGSCELGKAITTAKVKALEHIVPQKPSPSSASGGAKQHHVTISKAGIGPEVAKKVFDVKMWLSKLEPLVHAEQSIAMVKKALSKKGLRDEVLLAWDSTLDLGDKAATLADLVLSSE
jgi:hypothetical protein